MVSAGEMNTEDAADNSVRDPVLINARGHQLDTNYIYIVQGRNATNQDTNMAPAVETDWNDESASLVSDLVLNCAHDARLDANHLE
jgi:hypothetical protein